VPEYGTWQRLLTACFGLIMIVRAVIRPDVVCPPARIAHAINASNIISLAMIAALAIVSGVLIQRPDENHRRAGGTVQSRPGPCWPAQARRVTASQVGRRPPGPPVTYVRRNWLIHSAVAVNPPNGLKCSFTSP
jgi:hypothetical protein